MSKWTKAASEYWRSLPGILVARHLNTADDLFGGPQGSPRTDAMIAASVQWADKIMQKIDNVFGK